MITTVENKIVEMQFKADQFGKNVKDSIKMIDLLKSSLDFGKATKGLDEIDSGFSKLDRSVRSVSFSSITDGLDSIVSKFRISDVIAFTFFQNLTNSAINAGKALVKSLTVEQISAGWKKFEAMTTSVQTIMSATSQTWEESAKSIGFTGTQMEFVSDQLRRLNWFSDETSFSLTDMTDNIGKFTSNGVELQDAVTAMEGIAVWAAKSGQNATNASRAMYNMAQALGTGSVQLIDWKSIENANMATTEFKQTVIDTAVEMGVLKKKTDDLYKDAAGHDVSVTNFNENLKDKWFSSEVLMTTLDKYGKASVYLSEVSDTYGVTATGFLSVLDDYNDGTITLEDASKKLEIKANELGPIFETLNSEEYALGLSAFKAAQETKTFAESIEATKDAVSTGWMKSFEFIFGNYEEAKEFWTEFTERLWDIFAASGEIRNRILSLWKDAGGRDRFVESLWNIWDALDNIKEIGSTAFEIIFGKKTINNHVYSLTLLTKKFQNFSKNLLEFSNDGDKKIIRTFRNIFNVVKKVLDIFSSFGKGFKEGFKGVGDELNTFGTIVYNAFQKLLTNQDILSFLIKTKNVFYELGYEIGVFAKTFLHDLNTFLMSENKIKGFGDFLINTFNNLKKVINDFLKNAFGIEEYKPPKFVETVLDFFRSKLPILDSGFKQLQTMFSGFKDSFGNMGQNFKNMGGLFKNGLIDVFSTLAGGEIKIDKNSIIGLINSGILTAIFANLFGLVNNIKTLPDTAKKAVSELTSPFKKAADFFTKAQKSIGGVFDGLKGSLNSFQRDLNADILMKIAISVAILAGSIFLLSSINVENLAASLVAVSTLMGELVAAVSLLTALDPESLAKISVIGVVMKQYATAILILAVALKLLASLSYKEMIVGLVSIGWLMTYLTASAIALSLLKTNTKNAAKGLIAFSIAIVILAAAVRIIASLDLKQAAIGVGSIVILMNTLATVANKISGSKGLFGAGIAMIAMATSMIIMAKAIRMIGFIPFEQLKQGIISIVLLIVAMVGSLKILSNSKGMFGVSVALLAMAAALKIVASALEQISVLPSDKMTEAVSSMIKVMLVMAVALKILSNSKGMLSAAIAIVAMAASMYVIAKAMKQLAELPIDSINEAIKLLAVMAIAVRFMKGSIMGAIGMFIIAKALEAFVPALSGLSKLEFKKVVGGLLSLAAALAVIGVAGLVLGLLGPMFVLAGIGLALFGVGVLACGAGVILLAKGLLLLGKVGSKTIDKLGEIFVNIISVIPKFIVAIGDGFVKLIEYIAQRTPTIVDSFIKIGSAIIDGIIKMTPKIIMLLSTLIIALKVLIPQFIDLGFSILMAFLSGIRDNIGEMTEIGADIVINFINALAEKIPEMMQAGVDFIFSMIEAMGVGIKENSTRFYEVSKEFAKNVLEALQNVFDLMIEDIKKIGATILEKVKEGLNPIKNGVNRFKEIGKNVIQGFIDGIESMVEGLYKEMINVGKKVVDKFKEVLGIDSPSKVFKEFGKFTDEGFIEGIKSKSGKVIGAVTDLGNDVKDGMGEALSNLSSIDFDNLEEPTIRPVMDLSNIQNGISSMDNMLYAQRSMNLAGTVSIGRVDPNAEANRLKEAFEVSNSKFANDIIAAINDKTTDTNVNVTLAGDAGGVFRLVRSENDKFVKSTKYNPLSRSRV